jgi:hypothetical protein
MAEYCPAVVGIPAIVDVDFVAGEMFRDYCVKCLGFGGEGYEGGLGDGVLADGLQAVGSVGAVGVCAGRCGSRGLWRCLATEETFDVV